MSMKNLISILEDSLSTTTSSDLNFKLGESAGCLCLLGMIAYIVEFFFKSCSVIMRSVCNC